MRRLWTSQPVKFVILIPLAGALFVAALATGVKAEALLGAAPTTTTCTTTSKTVTIPGGASRTQTYPDGLSVTVPSQPQRTVPVPYKNCTTTVTQPGSTTTVTQPGQTVTVTQTVTDTTTTTNPPPTAACSDGLDNDGDSKIDFPTDPGCANTADTDETDPAPPGGEPAPIAGQGYAKVFGDEFDGSSLNTALWTPHNFWDETVPGSVSVANGILNIVNDRAGGYSESISVQSGPEYNGSPSRYDFTYGYAETRMRFTGGQGSWPAFWLGSTAHALWGNYPTCPKRDSSGALLAQANYELDILEWLGADPQTRYASQHSNTGNTCNAGESTRGADANMGFNPAGAWHTYSTLWTATETRFYVDGVQYGPTTQTFGSQSNQRMYILLTMQACGWDPPNGCNASTPDVLRNEVDWVHVWQK